MSLTPTSTLSMDFTLNTAQFNKIEQWKIRQEHMDGPKPYNYTYSFTPRESGACYVTVHCMCTDQTIVLS